MAQILEVVDKDFERSYPKNSTSNYEHIENKWEKNKQTEGLSKEIEDRKKIQMEILEMGNTVTKIKTHWMVSIAERIWARNDQWT